jgi:hypothetical protein
LLAVVVLAVVLVLSSAQNTLGVVTLAYDDGVAESSAPPPTDQYNAVRFVLADFGLSTVKILTARYMALDVGQTDPGPFAVHILGGGWPPGTDLITPFDVTPSTSGWFDVDLSGKNIVVSGDFYVAMQRRPTPRPPDLGRDHDAP